MGKNCHDRHDRHDMYNHNSIFKFFNYIWYMPITRLSEVYLPAFIYITDLILADEPDIDFKKIAEEGVPDKKEIDTRTIKRAFVLREELSKNILEQKVYRPSIKTLNTLCGYYFENPEERFLKINKTYKKEIQEYYNTNMPKPEVINAVFNPKPEKIVLIETKQHNYAKLKTMVEHQEINTVVSDMEKKVQLRFELLQKKMDDLAIKTQIINHLEIKIEELEKKLKQANFANNTLGSVGLFFVPINYDILTDDGIFEEFLDEYEGIFEDVIDDLI